MKRIVKDFVIALILFGVPLCGFSLYEYEHYSVKIGVLQGKNNVNFTNDIVLLGFDTNIKFFSDFFGSARFLISFPDSRYTMFLFEPFFWYVHDFLKFGDSFKLYGSLDIGIQNQSEFTSSTSNTNISSFQYYYFFIPFFRVVISGVIFDKLDLSAGWFGGYPLVFLPNTRPVFGVPVGYYLIEVGIRGLIFDRISFSYNPLHYILSVQNKF